MFMFFQNIYFLMNSYDLDELCQWVSNTKIFFSDKDFTIDGLLEYEEQYSSISPQVLEITRAEHNDIIIYQPVCNVWQKEEMCSSRVDNSPCESLPLDTAINDCCVPLLIMATTRIAADGNSLFQSVSLAVTGSQEFHEELRLLITTYMIWGSKGLDLSICG